MSAKNKDFVDAILTARHKQPKADQPNPVSVTPDVDQNGAVRKSEDSKIRTFDNYNIRTFEHSNSKPKKRGNKDGWARAVVTMEPKQYKKIKKHCLENDMTFQGFIEKLISEYFENERGKP